tara:strand:- start:1 stop:450 length:450 start_codon:yes stop_codon:yes gene_type:complete
MNTLVLYKITFIGDIYQDADVPNKIQQFLGVYKQAQIWIKSNALELFDADCAQVLYTCLENTLEGERLRGTYIQSGDEDGYFMVEAIHLKKSELLREIFNGTNDDLEKMYRQILRDVGEVAGSQNDIVIHEVMNTLIHSLEKGKYEPIA